MRIVLDTNVIVSALIWGGKPLKLLELAADGSVTLYTSSALIDELEDVLKREHLASRLTAKARSVEMAVTEYTQLAISVTPKSVPRIVPDDVDDDQVIAAAITAGAEVIVSGDSDLLKIAAHYNIKILNVSEALIKLDRI